MEGQRLDLHTIQLQAGNLAGLNQVFRLGFAGRHEEYLAFFPFFILKIADWINIGGDIFYADGQKTGGLV